MLSSAAALLSERFEHPREVRYPGVVRGMDSVSAHQFFNNLLVSRLFLPLFIEASWRGVRLRPYG